MWVVGSIGIVIEEGDWAGFGPQSGYVCCLKRHMLARCYGQHMIESDW